MESFLEQFYKGKKVLVTGHTGFKGSWLTLWLLQLGAKVAGFSAYLPSEPCNFKILGLENQIEDFQGDIRDFSQLRAAFDHFDPEIVFHLAAQPIVRKSYDEPKLTFDSNVGGTVNILECIRLNQNVKTGVIITSDKCYKNVEWIWGYREGDTLGGDDPYSASKACAETVINSYCRSFFNDRVKIASTRAGNVIGGGDWAQDRIVPDCVRAWSQGKSVEIRSPQATRPWQHVLEPLSGYLWLGLLLGQGKTQSGEAFNFGPRAEVIQPVGTLISTFQSYWEAATWNVVSSETGKKESGLLKLCCDKALGLLEWSAVLSFEETVEYTASWYKKYYQEGGESMHRFSLEQIAGYCALARERGLKWAR